MSRWVFDIETDNLLDKCTRMWILAAYNLDTKKMHYWLEGDLGWMEEFDRATLIIGHNILGFDVYALKKLFNYDFPKSCNMHDTLIMSQVLNYKRFGSEGHSLKVWGKYLNYPKHDYEDFSQYTEEMLAYCLQDVRLSNEVYNVVKEEFNALAQKAPQIVHYLRAEHAVAKWCTQASLYGWPFDLKAAHKLHDKLQEEMNKAYTALSSKLGMKTVAVDKKKGIV